MKLSQKNEVKEVRMKRLVFFFFIKNLIFLNITKNEKREIFEGNI